MRWYQMIVNDQIITSSLIRQMSIEEPKQVRQYQLPYTKPHWPLIEEKLLKLQNREYQDTRMLSILLVELYTINKDFHTKYESYFDSLQKLPFQHLQSIFSKIASFVLKQKERYSKGNSRKFYLLEKHQNSEQVFTQEEVILLMCLSALGINSLNLSPDKGAKKQPFHNEVNFIFMYSKGKFIDKAPWIFNYFETVLDEKFLEQERNNKMSVIRKSIKELTADDLLKSDAVLSPMAISEDGSIEDYSEVNTVKIDFANKFIGGGALGHGCVQEEIMFLNHPELYITMLFCEVMDPNEAIGMRGFRKYFKNEGYADTTKYAGHDETMKYTKEEEYLNDYIVAIDALCRPKEQDSEKMILREINKSFVGFSLYQKVRRISTGNWGCGAFGGNPQLKFIIQWISSSLVEKEVLYYTFKNKNMANYHKVVDKLEGKKVSEVFKHLLGFKDQCEKTVFQYMLDLE